MTDTELIQKLAKESSRQFHKSVKEGDIHYHSIHISFFVGPNESIEGELRKAIRIDGKKINQAT